MQKNTQSLSEYVTPTTILELVVDNTVSITGSSRPQNDLSGNQVAPRGYTAIGDLIAEFESTEDGRAQLNKGRKWVADKFYSEDGDTIKTMRLQNGWSQSALAELLGTSQSHVARIERGTENLVRTTLTRLCVAFDVDMNTLDEALSRQEKIWSSKSCD